MLMLCANFIAALYCDMIIPFLHTVLCCCQLTVFITIIVIIIAKTGRLVHARALAVTGCCAVPVKGVRGKFGAPRRGWHWRNIDHE